MNDHPDALFSTIAELLFLQAPPMNFARLVGDLDAVLARVHQTDRILTWDCEDIASFDMPGTRIVLATSENPRPGVAASLTISVGPSHLPALESDDDSKMSRHAEFCSKLVERVQPRLRADAVFWHECEGLVGAETIDLLAYSVPTEPPPEARHHPIFDRLDDHNIDAVYARGFGRSGAKADSAKARRATHLDFAARLATKFATNGTAPDAENDAARQAASNDQPHIPRERNMELTRIRTALYPEETPPPPHLVSPQLRLAAHTMNATLIMVALPVGAAMLTYSVLRGENMRLTTAALVATGFASTLLQSPFGQQLVSIAGS